MTTRRKLASVEDVQPGHVRRYNTDLSDLIEEAKTAIKDAQILYIRAGMPIYAEFDQLKERIFENSNLDDSIFHMSHLVDTAAGYLIDDFSVRRSPSFQKVRLVLLDRIRNLDRENGSEDNREDGSDMNIAAVSDNSSEREGDKKNCKSYAMEVAPSRGGKGVRRKESWTEEVEDDDDEEDEVEEDDEEEGVFPVTEAETVIEVDYNSLTVEIPTRPLSTIPSLYSPYTPQQTSAPLIKRRFVTVRK